MENVRRAPGIPQDEFTDDEFIDEEASEEEDELDRQIAITEAAAELRWAHQEAEERYRREVEEAEEEERIDGAQPLIARGEYHEAIKMLRGGLDTITKGYQSPRH